MIEESAEKNEAGGGGEVQKPDRSETERETRLIRRLDAFGWGLFLIWLGIVLLAKAQTSVALLGIGIIMLGVQLARVVLRLRLEVFWFVAGLLFIVGALWQLANARIPLVPILLIAAGVALVLTRFLPRQKKEG